MGNEYINDPMLELFLFETNSQLEQLEQTIVQSEAQKVYEPDTINEIFRIMHTIKSSAAMMLLENISVIAHRAEDLFYYIRENKVKNLDTSAINDLMLQVIDYIKQQLEHMKEEGEEALDTSLMERISFYLEEMREKSHIVEEPKVEEDPKYFYVSPLKTQKSNNENIFRVNVFFEEVEDMENIRAFTIVHNLQEISQDFYYFPEDIIENSESSSIIRKEGFTIFLKTNKDYEEVQEFFSHISYTRKVEIMQQEKEIYEAREEKFDEQEIKVPLLTKKIEKGQQTSEAISSLKQAMINVSIKKLDKLMDLVGEMVTAESMVTQNPDLRGLPLENFDKAARQLRKITSELQETVMSIRMVHLGPTFFKMNRIVRDMSKKLGKQVNLDIIGEDTEVDKNIIEHIADPIMHLVRNAIDHGIEAEEEREKQEKPKVGTITLEAKNAGNEVLIFIKDDGKGLDKEKIKQKAINNELIEEKEELTEEEIFGLILLPGFSTKESVTEFSGRGVGMDVVLKNIEKIGGSIQVQSEKGAGTTIILKIPITLAIIEGMNIRVGNASYTLPITVIKESFRPKEEDVFKDPEGNEMIEIRGDYYKVIRLYQFFNVETKVTSVEEGILIMLEQEGKAICIFVDELLGEQQVVVKPLPLYIKQMKKTKGIGGCTLLGDGSISLILDTETLME